MTPGSPTPAPSEAPPPPPDSPGPPPGKAGTQSDTRFRPSLSEDRPQGGGAKGGRSGGRSAALQAFFIANSGRALMPAGENSGALKPTVRPED